MDNIIIEIENLGKEFKGVTIFKNINMKLEKGNIYGFVGPNGCGKSILFKIICGFLKADTGKVRIQGDILGDNIDFPKDTGILIETPGFLEEYSQYKNLKYLADIKGIINDEEIKEALELVGLDSNNNNKVKKFSLGMRQKLGIAQAIMEKPKILILDEPFNGLDKDSVKNIYNLLGHLKKLGTTILLTSHIDGDLEKLSDCIFEFSGNTLVEIK